MGWASLLFLTALSLPQDKKDPYADKPYWYKPGHPLNPAEASAVKTPKDFVAERILTVPKEMGSWTAITVDPKGRLITAAQHVPGLFRVTTPRIGDPEARTKVERLKGTAEKVGWSHGLLYAFDSLYVTVTEKGSVGQGIYRLKDTDGDDQYDTLDKLIALKGSGEHGPHNMVVSPDGKTLTFIAGNGTRLPDRVDRRRTVATKGADHLMPPGFDTTKHTTAGWVCRFDPEGKNWELVCSGLRNSFDIAYNRHGELFTFDSDMEWDLGTPWYRPTRVCQLVSGAEFGWRNGTGKWPEYYPDSVRPVVNVGPSSPTGLTFGYGAKFPAPYQRALYVCDWTFATIHAIHLKPSGSGYEGTIEEFAAGRGLPVTDAVIGRDGAMYFIVGGRRLGSAVYRVRYTGPEDTAPAESIDTREASELRAIRRSLEAFHGTEDEDAIDTVWPYLGHADRGLRFAARVAVEHQPVSTWRKRALSERSPEGLLALARQGEQTDLNRVVEALGKIDFTPASADRKLVILRAYELAFARGASRDSAERVAAHLDKAYPDPDGRVSREMARLLCTLNAPNIVERTLNMMEADAGHPETLGKTYFARNDKYGKAVADMLDSAPMVHRMHLAQMLIWVKRGWTPELRRRYFQLIADGTAHSKGGYWYRDFWERTRKHALEAVPAGPRKEMESIRAGKPAVIDPRALPKPKGPGRTWTIDSVLAEMKNGLKGRNLANGKEMYAAASCIVCHRIAGEGGTVGPRLMGLERRFTLRDLVETIVEPSKAVSDQYAMVQIRKKDGSILSGRVSFLEGGTYHLMPDMLHPGQTVTVPAAEIDKVRALTTSPMPTRLLDALNRNEVLDLMAYLLSEGDPKHRAFQTSWVHPPSAEMKKQIPGLEHGTFLSASMKARVGYNVVLPPDYEKSVLNYPVVYWLHGGGGNESSSLFTALPWQRLMAERKIQQVILVYPSAYRSGYMDHHDGKVMAETMIIKELIPLIDRTYQTIATRHGRAAHGFSMGASGSLKFAIKYPEMFASAVAYGGGAIDLENSTMPFIVNILKRNLNGDPDLIRKNNTYFYLGKNQEAVLKNGLRFLLICGDKDSWVNSAVTFDRVLREKNIPSKLITVPGVRHNLRGLTTAEGETAARFQDEVFRRIPVDILRPNR